jgi:hypothetical protein
MPDIASASSATGVPGQDWIGWNSRRAIEVDDAFPGEGERTANVVEISKGYFATYDINLLAGRAFDDADHAGGTLVAIVNEPFVHKHLGPGGAIGRKVRWGTASEGGSIEWRPWLEIVGVIPDIGVDPADPGSADAIYEPLSPSNIVLMSVRTRGELPALTSALYEVVAGEETGAEVQSLYTLEELVAGPAGPLRTVGLGAVVVGAITLLLSACGLYAIMSFTVTRRTREIGIRLALGAGASRVIGSILLQAAVPLGAGALLGIALGSTSALVLAWLLPLDPLRAGAGVLVVVSGLMIAVGVVACLAPARRALSVRPVEALRNS